MTRTLWAVILIVIMCSGCFGVSEHRQRNMDIKTLPYKEIKFKAVNRRGGIVYELEGRLHSVDGLIGGWVFYEKKDGEIIKHTITRDKILTYIIEEQCNDM